MLRLLETTKALGTATAATGHRLCTYHTATMWQLSSRHMNHTAIVVIIISISGRTAATQQYHKAHSSFEFAELHNCRCNHNSRRTITARPAAKPTGASTDSPSSAHNSAPLIPSLVLVTSCVEECWFSDDCRSCELTGSSEDSKTWLNQSPLRVAHQMEPSPTCALTQTCLS